MDRDHDKHYLPSMTLSKQTPGGPDTPDAANESLLAAPAGGAPALDTNAVWRPIANHLAALIGDGGFCALLGRATRTLSARYPWLSTEARASIDMSLNALQRDMAAADPAVAAIANRELLETFTRQLSTLIGAALTERLLKEAGTPPNRPEDGQEYQ